SLVGWYLHPGRPQLAHNPDLTPSADGPAPDRPAPSILLGAINRDVHLAQASGPVEQLDALVHLADDLRGEALRRVRAGTPDELPLLASLYDQVVRRGVVGKAAALPVEQKPTVVPKIS